MSDISQTHECPSCVQIIKDQYDRIATLEQRLAAAEKVCEASNELNRHLWVIVVDGKLVEAKFTGLTGFKPETVTNFKQALSDYQAKFGGRSDGQ